MKSPVLLSSEIIQKHRHYLPVLVIFFLAVYYHYLIAPTTALEHDDVKVATTKQPTLSSRNPEKIYENVFQPQQGDVFRVGVVLQAEKAQTIEVAVHSIFGDRVTVGELRVEPTRDEVYKELVFVAPGRYQDIALRLTGSLEENGSWRDSSVTVNTIFVSRIEAENLAEVGHLEPTVFGMFQTQAKSFSIEQRDHHLLAVLKVPFLAESEFIRSIDIRDGFLDGETGISASLSTSDGAEGATDEEVRSVIFPVTMLSPFRKPEGGYEIPFLSLLKPGQKYLLTITKEGQKKNTMLPQVFRTDTDRVVGNQNKLNVVLNFGSIMRHRSGGKVMDNARLEDLGEAFSYQFSFQKSETDFLNLSQASKTVRFDQKEKMVGGSKKPGEYFVYTFDTLYPFQVFSFKATQSGNAANALALEYSFDDTLWKAVPFTQESSGPQKFSLSLPGDQTNHAVSLRVRYIGQTKKTGLFGLKDLAVNAVVPKSVK
jgi:hypothetical protein